MAERRDQTLQPTARRLASIELAQLHKDVSEELDGDPDWSFGRMDDPRAVLNLDDLLRPRTSRPQRRSNIVRQSIVSALSSIGDDHALSQIIDIEAGLPPQEVQSEAFSPKSAASPQRSSDDDEQDAVGWDGPDDPEHPYNLPSWRIKLTSALLASLAFLVPLSSSILAPAAHQVLIDFHNDSELLEAFVVSVFVLGLAFGPLIWAPLSEIYGRIYVYHGTNIGFIVFTVACGVAPSLSSLIAFRFFAGFFGSCILANGGGSFSDMMPPEKRGIFLTFFVLGPVLGPVIGPVGGGFLASAKGWPWLFWLVTILVGFVALMLVIFTKETYAPILLRRKVERLRRETGNPRLRAKGQNTMSPWAILRHNIVRPLRLSILSPVSIIYSLDIAIVYGILNLLFTSISQVYQETYNFAPNISGLAFLGLGIGCVIGVVTAGATSNMYTEYVRQKTGVGRKPEHRIFLQPFGAALIPAGLFIYGWTAEYKVHWIVPIIGEGITGLGIMLIFGSTVLYLVDAFTVVAASALAANGLIRSIAGGLLPLAGLTLYSKLGVGWGNSVLAFISLIILPISIGMVRYGEALRNRYPVKNL